MSLKSKIRYLIPVPIKKGMKYIYYSLLDFQDWILKRRDPLYPPRRLNFVGSHDFKKVGDEFLEHFKKIGQLKPGDAVLDIGSGIGRMAIPLTQYLSEKSLYRGFDIDRRGIEWCQKNLTPLYPHFKFEYVDLYNKYYNRHGKILAKDFKFPYEDETFDFIFATSVFTHMLPHDIENYLHEIHRVLKPGGRYFLTWFIQPDNATKPLVNFTYTHHEYDFLTYSHKSNPEAELCYTREWLENAMKKSKLNQNLKIHPGWWRGIGDQGLSYQDVVVGGKS